MLRRRRRDAGHPLVRGRLARYIGKPLTWDIQSGERLAVVVVDGELDAGTVAGLSGQLEPLADSGSHLILNLAGLRFCDCAGLTLFLRMQQRAHAAGGSLQLVAPTASVRRLIALTRLSGVLPITLGPAVVIAALDGTAISGRPLTILSSPARTPPATG
jgi:anti-sigma B factor antagonist